MMNRSEHRRPALDALILDIREVRRDMLAGFRTREQLVWWMLDVSRATLGQVEMDHLCQLGRELSTTTDDGEVSSVAALLVPAARSRDMHEDAAERFREAMASRMLEPATHRAVRVLTVSATEYVDDSRRDSSEHDPSRQQATAMRPAVDEEVERQTEVLEELLEGRLVDDPHTDGVHVLDWIDKLDVASDGLMAILDRMAVETSFRQLLTGGRNSDARAREVVAARWIIPVFTLAIRRVAQGANEVPDAAPLDKEIPMA